MSEVVANSIYLTTPQQNTVEVRNPMVTNLNGGNFRITHLAYPVQDHDVATKVYVDNNAGGTNAINLRQSDLSGDYVIPTNYQRVHLYVNATGSGTNRVLLPLDTVNPIDLFVVTDPNSSNVSLVGSISGSAAPGGIFETSGDSLTGPHTHIILSANQYAEVKTISSSGTASKWVRL